MPKSDIPQALTMREIKYVGTDEARRDRVAEALRAEGRHAEAILLYEGRPDHPAVREERLRAVKEGLSFSLVALGRLGVKVAAKDWEACARAAEAKGRWMDAQRAWKAAGNEEAVLAFAERLPPSLRPAPAAPDED